MIKFVVYKQPSDSMIVLIQSLLLTFSVLVLPVNSGEIAAGELKVVDFEGLEDFLASYDDDKTLVINFWATWCVPCVKELPYFEQAHSTYESDEVEIILVSLDFKKQIDQRVVPFIEKHDLQSTLLLLDAPDANAWIDKVSPDWSGAIPATLIKKGKESAFYEQEFHSFEELNQIIQPFLNS